MQHRDSEHLRYFCDLESSICRGARQRDQPRCARPYPSVAGRVSGLDAVAAEATRRRGRAQLPTRRGAPVAPPRGGAPPTPTANRTALEPIEVSCCVAARRARDRPGSPRASRRSGCRPPLRRCSHDPARILLFSTKEVAPMSATATNAERIKTDPDPYDRFNIALGYRIGDLVLLSGQAAIDEDGNLVGAGDFDAQAEQVFKNLKRVLEDAGSSLEQVVKVNIYLTDMSHFPKIVELRSRYFSRPWPADTIVGVTALALPELMIEIEATALVDGNVVE